MTRACAAVLLMIGMAGAQIPPQENCLDVGPNRVCDIKLAPKKPAALGKPVPNLPYNIILPPGRPSDGLHIVRMRAGLVTWEDDAYPELFAYLNGHAEAYLIPRVASWPLYCDDPGAVGQTCQVKPDPLDVPAMQETAPGTGPVVLRDPYNCVDGWMENSLVGNHCASRKYWTCADKARILEHDEAVPQKYWCRKVQP